VIEQILGDVGEDDMTRQAEIDDTFDASEVTARLAGLAEVLIPAS